MLDAATGREIARTRGPGAWWGSAGTFPGSAGDAALEHIAKDGRVRVVCPGGGSVTASAAAPDGVLAVAYDFEKGFLLHRGGELGSLFGRGGDDWSGPVNALRFSDDGTRFAAGTSDGHVLVFDVASKKRTAHFRDTAGGSVTALLFLPGGGRVATADRFGTVVVWDPKLAPK